MYSKYAWNHVCRYFRDRKNQCGDKDKIMKLTLYIELIWYYMCTKDELLTNTTTYYNIQSYNSLFSNSLSCHIHNEHCKILLQNYLKAKIQLYVPSLDREMFVATERTICNITNIRVTDGHSGRSRATLMPCKNLRGHVRTVPGNMHTKFEVQV